MGEGPTNILVSGGIRGKKFYRHYTDIFILQRLKMASYKKYFTFLGEVRMFHPARKVCFHEWRPVDKKNIAVNSIVFHSEVITNYSYIITGHKEKYSYIITDHII